MFVLVCTSVYFAYLSSLITQRKQICMHDNYGLITLRLLLEATAHMQLNLMAQCRRVVRDPMVD